jgi:hypothetical protein
MTILITSCSARKRIKGNELCLSPEQVGADLNETITNWRRAVSERSNLYKAKDLYAGRSVTEASRAAAFLGSPLFFISAGMGVVGADEMIPAYNLSPVESSGGLSVALRRHSVSASDWWSNLSSNALSQMIRRQDKHLLLIALPASYLRMLSTDLLSCLKGDVNRIRIFTSSAGIQELPDFLHAAVMPYDERLETVFQFTGTRSDFPQRAMRHYVENLKAHKLNLIESRDLVEKFIVTCGRRKVPNRRRLNDSQIKSLISDRWNNCWGQSSKLLRALRDDEMVACEQGRFTQLWREVKNERIT